MTSRRSSKLTKGFTLIEVMLVIVLIGVFAAAIQFNFFSNKPEKALEQEAKRFYGLFNIATEYGLLNNIELGIVFTENSYQFVGFDGNDWVALPDQEQLQLIEFKDENMLITLKLDDLPIDEPILFDPQSMLPEEDDFDPEEEKITPQVFILSGGDISPFQVRFSYRESYDQPTDVFFQVFASHSLPIEFTGPLTDES